jgi:hypothetical protein
MERHCPRVCGRGGSAVEGREDNPLEARTIWIGNRSSRQGPGHTNYSVPASGSNIVVPQPLGQPDGSIIDSDIGVSDIGVATDDLVVTSDAVGVEEAAAYLRGIEEELATRDRAAKVRLWIYRFLRFAMLSASAATPVLALLHAPAVATAVVGAVVLLAEGAIQITRVQDRALLDTERASKLGREYRMYRTAKGDYATGNRFALLVPRVEELRADNDLQVLEVLQRTFAGTPSPGQLKNKD